MSSVQTAAVWAVSACAVGGILLRPRRTPEWTWAVAGGVLAAIASAMSPGDVARAVWRGADVYAFLVGILSLAELARSEQVFEILALRLLRAAAGSQGRLFALVFAAGTIITALLSNDTTVVVLTPAVLAMLARTQCAPLPFLYICAFVANAASFVFPISNPANLVLFGDALPPLIPWLRSFGLAAAAAILLTYAAMRLLYRRKLHERYSYRTTEPATGRTTAWTTALLVLSAMALVAATSFGMNVGYTALGAAVVSFATISARAPASAAAAIRHTPWSIVPLVAGLFVIVSALDRSGAIDAIRMLLERSDSIAGVFSIGAIMMLACNLFNNLPVALASGVALQSASVTPRVAHATLVAIDLGPNLAVSGSLATLLWLVVLRREGIDVTVWQFSQIGTVVLLPALGAALLLVH